MVGDAEAVTQLDQGRASVLRQLSAAQERSVSKEASKLGAIACLTLRVPATFVSCTLREETCGAPERRSS